MQSIEKQLFEHFPYAQLILCLSAEKILTLELWNPAAAALYGIAANHSGNRPLHSVMIKSMADFLEMSSRRCVQQNKTLITEPFPVHPVTETPQSFTFTPISGEKGVTHITITALPYAAKVAELQKERDHALMLMSSAFDASPMGIFVSDRDRRILRVNEAFLRDFGFRRRDVIGKDFTQLYVATDRRGATQTYKSFLQGQNETRHEWRLHREDDKESDVLVTMAPLHIHPDRPLVVHTLIDISDHKNLEEALRCSKEEADTANQAKSTFLAGMSHELRTPLNAILGFSELIKNQIFGSVGHAKYLEYVNDIHFAAGHLLEIINDVLDMSKIEAGKFELIETPTDIPALFQSVIRLMTDRADASKLRIETHIETDIGPIFGDKRVLRQMLFNLLSNAIRFSDAGGVILVGANIEPQSGNICLFVQDYGRGMDPQDINRLLEPFNQDLDSINEGHGTGLGLPLTRAMAELHDGRLDITSMIGMGTTVTITLPKKRRVIIPLVDKLKRFA